MRMITDDVMEVHFCLRQLKGAQSNAYYLNYLGVSHTRELRHLRCWSSNCNNTFKDEPAKWLKLGQVCDPSLPNGPIALPALGRRRSELKNTNITLMEFEPTAFRPAA